MRWAIWIVAPVALPLNDRRSDVGKPRVSLRSTSADTGNRGHDFTVLRIALVQHHYDSLPHYCSHRKATQITIQIVRRKASIELLDLVVPRFFDILVVV